MPESCPECGSSRVRTRLLGEPHRSTEVVVEEEPQEYERAELEVVVDAQTGYVLREPERCECERCGAEWHSECSYSVEEIEEEMRREQLAKERDA